MWKAKLKDHPHPSATAVVGHEKIHATEGRVRVLLSNGQKWLHNKLKIFGVGEQLSEIFKGFMQKLSQDLCAHAVPGYLENFVAAIAHHHYLS